MRYVGSTELMIIPYISASVTSQLRNQGNNQNLEFSFLEGSKLFNLEWPLF